MQSEMLFNPMWYNISSVFALEIKVEDREVKEKDRLGTVM
jgi:hypothetical protein